jgi:hypothetical protein
MKSAMENSKSPKLRTINKSVSAFPLNEFPKDFPFILGKELIYLLASKGKPELEGKGLFGLSGTLTN